MERLFFRGFQCEMELDYITVQGWRNLFVRYGHGQIGFLTQQVSVLINFPVKLLIEIGKPK